MDKLELYVNQQAIDEQTEAVETAKVLVQELCDKMKEAHAYPTLTHLYNIIGRTMFLKTQDKEFEKYLEGEIKNLIISQKSNDAPIEVIGLPVNEEKLKELISIPNYKDIENIVLSFDHGTREGLTKYLVLSDNQIDFVPDYKEQITEKNTTYAYGAKQIEAATKLKALRDGLNDWIDFSGVEADTDNIRGLKPSEMSPKHFEVDENYIERL